MKTEKEQPKQEIEEKDENEEIYKDVENVVGAVLSGENPKVALGGLATSGLTKLIKRHIKK